MAQKNLPPKAGSGWVLYIADQDVFGVPALYSVLPGGGASTRRSGSLAAGGDVVAFQMSPNPACVPPCRLPPAPQDVVALLACRLPPELRTVRLSDCLTATIRGCGRLPPPRGAN
jgi:hypothetical protein